MRVGFSEVAEIRDEAVKNSTIQVGYSNVT